MRIKIGFVSRHEVQSLYLAKMLVEWLGPQAEVLVDPDIAAHLGVVGKSVEEMEKAKVDFIVSVGGDGTILRTIHKMVDPLPILGINMGTLGFLVDVEPDGHQAVHGGRDRGGPADAGAGPRDHAHVPDGEAAVFQDKDLPVGDFRLTDVHGLLPSLLFDM